MSESLEVFLANHGLSTYLATFQEEEINDVALLKSMGVEMLCESMEELGMEKAHIDTLSAALFGSGSPSDEADDDDDGLELEGNDDDDDEVLALEENDDAEGSSSPALEENASPPPPPPPPVPAAAPAAPPPVSDASKKAAERVKAQGNDALKQNKFTEAVSLYGQAIGLDPTNAVYYSNRASARCSLEQYDRALADAHKCVELRPDWAKGHLRLGAAHTGLRKLSEAKAAFSAALTCEPSNAQIRALHAEASERVEAEALLANDVFDWMTELNARVPPNAFYEKGLELQDDSPMTVDYKAALSEALSAIVAEEGQPVLRTASGATGFLVESLAGTNFEKLVLTARRATATAVRGAAKQVAVKLWHMKRDWRDEGDDDDAIAERMQRRARAEHTRIRQLAGCKHWLQLVADVAAEKEARIGGEPYSAIFLEHFPGKDITEVLGEIVRPPRKKRKNGQKGQPNGAHHSHRGGADDSDEDSDDSDEEDERKAAVDEEALKAWEAAKRQYTPARLKTDLQMIHDFSLGILRGMKEANEVGFRFEKDGSEGPFLGDVMISTDGKVKLVDTEPLGEFDEGEDRRFTAEPLVYSPFGDFVRSWWLATAEKIGMPQGQKCPDPKFQSVLDGFGTLNWLLFQWKPEQLHGDEIIHLLVHGPQAAAAAPDPTVEAHWEDFMQRAFIMLGPQRFDALKEINELLQAGEIEGKDVVARSRYVMGREFEGMHEEYVKLLKKIGVKLK